MAIDNGKAFLSAFLGSVDSLVAPSVEDILVLLDLESMQRLFMVQSPMRRALVQALAEFKAGANLP